MERSDGSANVRVIGAILILISVLGFAYINAYSAGPAVNGLRGERIRLAQQNGDDKKTAAEESFRKMCEFLELDEQQTTEAAKLFEARLREISEISAQVQSGGLARQEAGQKLTESFKAYREKFEKLLSEAQKARLGQWENPASAKAGKKRAALNDSERVSQEGSAAART